MIKRIARHILSFVLYYSGFITLLRHIQKNQKKIRILVYHRVNDDLEGSSPALPVLRFGKHMEYLKRYYRIINLNDAASYIEYSEKFISGAVAVTFDDGYKDIIKNVFPIIKEFNIPIAVFLTSGCIGDDKLLWTDELYLFFKERGRLNGFYSFRENLKNMDNTERLKIISDFKPESKRSLMLNWEEVRELSQDECVEIGAHTQTHPILTKIEANAALREISGSKKDIEQIIQQPIFGFSYPAGKFNPTIKRLIAESGFTYACSVDGRFNTKDSDLYSLSRINIDNCPVFVFAAELCGIVNWLRKVFS